MMHIPTSCTAPNDLVAIKERSRSVRAILALLAGEVYQYWDSLPRSEPTTAPVVARGKPYPSDGWGEVKRVGELAQ